MKPAKISLAYTVVVGALLVTGSVPQALHGSRMAFALAPPADAAQTDFFVSPKGNDHWSGRLAEPNKDDGPFATVARVQQAVRALLPTLNPRRTVRVVLRGGVYYLDETLTFGPDDSGADRRSGRLHGKTWRGRGA